MTPEESRILIAESAQSADSRDNASGEQEASDTKESGVEVKN